MTSPDEIASAAEEGDKLLGARLAAKGRRDFTEGLVRQEAERKGTECKPKRPWINAQEIEAKMFKEPVFAVPGLIPAGLTILAGKPKIGKSWLALGIADAISRGVPALGSIEVKKGPVLYLALEDNERRLQKRMRAVRQGAEASVDLGLATSWPKLDEGGLDLLNDELAVIRFQLVVVDVFAKVRPTPSRDNGVYLSDYESIAPLKQLADKWHTPIVALHHLRKGASDDPLEEISGSTGLTGAADGVLVLKRQRGNRMAEIFVTGRDVEEQELAVDFDSETGRWSVLGEASTFRQSDERMQLMNAMKEIGEPASPRDIAETIGSNLSAVRMMLSRMKKQGLVKKEGRGLYVLL